MSSTASSAPVSPPANTAIPVPAGTKYEKMKKVYYGGQLIYSWEQNIDEVNMYIPAPPGVSAKQFNIEISERHLMVGLKGADRPYLDEDLGGLIVKDESYWTLEDGTLHFQFQKAFAAETWPYCTKHQGSDAPLSALDATALAQEQQKILLERFQREHPGFDFSNATVNGETPDPRTFLGGFDRDKVIHGKR